MLKNPEYNAIKVVLLVLIAIGVGVMTYNISGNRESSDAGQGRVINTKTDTTTRAGVTTTTSSLASQEAVDQLINSVETNTSNEKQVNLCWAKLNNGNVWSHSCNDASCSAFNNGSSKNGCIRGGNQ